MGLIIPRPRVQISPPAPSFQCFTTGLFRSTSATVGTFVTKNPRASPESELPCRVVKKPRNRRSAKKGITLDTFLERPISWTSQILYFPNFSVSRTFNELFPNYHFSTGKKLLCGSLPKRLIPQGREDRFSVRQKKCLWRGIVRKFQL